MQKIFRPFTLKFKTSPRVWILILPVFLGGLTSIFWYLQKACACIPKAQEQIRHVRTLNRLQQTIDPQKGILTNSLGQLNQQTNLQPESNFYKISMRATKLAVINYGKIKPKHENNPTFKNVVSTVLSSPQSQLSQLNTIKSKQIVCPTDQPTSSHNLSNCTPKTSRLE